MQDRAALNLHAALPDPDVLAREIVADLSAALEQFKGIVGDEVSARRSLETRRLRDFLEQRIERFIRAAEFELDVPAAIQDVIIAVIHGED